MVRFDNAEEPPSFYRISFSLIFILLLAIVNSKADVPRP